MVVSYTCNNIKDLDSLHISSMSQQSDEKPGPDKEEDEFQLRRRRIAQVFMQAYGKGQSSKSCWSKD